MAVNRCEQPLVGDQDILVLRGLSDFGHNLPFDGDQIVLVSVGFVIFPEGKLMPGGRLRRDGRLRVAVLNLRMG